MPPPFRARSRAWFPLRTIRPLNSATSHRILMMIWVRDTVCGDPFPRSGANQGTEKSERITRCHPGLPRTSMSLVPTRRFLLSISEAQLTSRDSVLRDAVCGDLLPYLAPKSEVRKKSNASPDAPALPAHVPPAVGSRSRQFLPLNSPASTRIP